MSADNDPLLWLQAFMVEQCDGEWEHDFGIEIASTDNPGWRVVIDLTGTAYEDLQLSSNPLRSGGDIVLRVDNKVFDGSGGVTELTKILHSMKSVLVSSRASNT